jgi:hypothetical protein
MQSKSLIISGCRFRDSYITLLRRLYCQPRRRLTVFNVRLICIFRIIVLSSRYSDELRAGRPGFDSRQGQDFSRLHNVQTGSGAHPATYPMGTGAIFPGVKRQGREADHSPTSSAEVKNGGAIPPIPDTSSRRGA